MSLSWSKKSTFLIAGLVAMGLLLGSLVIALQKPVTVVVDGKLLKTRVLFAGNVEDVLEKNDVTLGKYDTVQPGLDSAVEKHMKIIVSRAFKVKIIADGKEKTIYTTPVAIKTAIAKAGVKLGDKDIVKTLPEPKVVANQEIEIIRVAEKEIQQEAPVPYGEERVDDPTLEKGLTRTVKAGVNGVAVNTVKVTFYNGQEGKREIIATKTIKEPQNRVVAMGSITEVSRGGQRFDIREARYMQASAYTYTGFRTATGLNPEVGMVAVDPSVIPLGSRLYIEGYGYARAADTGGAVKGNKIDLFMEQRSQCLNWGRKTVKVYILQ